MRLASPRNRPLSMAHRVRQQRATQRSAATSTVYGGETGCAYWHIRIRLQIHPHVTTRCHPLSFVEVVNWIYGALISLVSIQISRRCQTIRRDGALLATVHGESFFTRT